MFELDQRRIADRLDDVVVELHVGKNTVCFLCADPKGPQEGSQADEGRGSYPDFANTT
jgi:hypothetical protein